MRRAGQRVQAAAISTVGTTTTEQRTKPLARSTKVGEPQSIRAVWAITFGFFQSRAES